MVFITDSTEIEFCGKDMEEAYQMGRENAINEYKKLLLEKLIPHLDKISCAKDSETYIAITEIAEQLKEK